ncbi:MAG: hypothetical protein ACOX6D_03640 [Thermoguttaceae bacterium]
MDESQREYTCRAGTTGDTEEQGTLTIWSGVEHSRRRTCLTRGEEKRSGAWGLLRYT